MAYKTIECPTCLGSGDNEVGHPCNHCGGTSRILDPGKQRDSALLKLAQDKLIEVICSLTDRAINRLPDCRIDDAIENLRQSQHLLQVLAILKAEIEANGEHPG